jgi:hypothetical protein
MLRKGYIEQQIEGLAQAMVRLLGIGGENRAAALQEISLAARDLTGLNPDSLVALSDDSVLTMFVGGDKSRTAGNSYVMARLLTERAERDEPNARRTRRKALILFAEALAQEQSLHTPEVVAEFGALLKQVPQADWTPLLLAQLNRAREAMAEAKADRENPGPPET